MTPVMSESGDLILEDRFAIVPEWLLDAEIGDCAVRLYAVLLRYGQSSGSRMPSRSALARRLHKRSTDTVDRAMKELASLGAVRVEHRYDGAQRLTNAYRLRTSRPTPSDAPRPTGTGSRTDTATHRKTPWAGRKDASRVAAGSGDYPEHLTDNTSPSDTGCPPPARRSAELTVAASCGIINWPGFVGEIQRVRRQFGVPVNRWAGLCLAAALQFAVHDRGLPAEQAAMALQRVAADPETRSPMRVAEAGSWWDEITAAEAIDETVAMEHALAESGGARIRLQNQARAELTAQGLPGTRAALTCRAYEPLVEESGAA